MRVAALIVAAGRGVRAGGDVPKQYRPIGGRSALARCVDLFSEVSEITDVIPVILSEHEGHFAALRLGGRRKLRAAVHGRETRQASVLAGLRSLSEDPPECVLVHDAARPFATPRLVRRAIEAAAITGAAAPGIAIADTLVHCDADGRPIAALPRDGTLAVQTPQAFRFAMLLEAHEAAERHGAMFSDDAGLAAAHGADIRYFSGEPGNIKLTTPEDFGLADRRCAVAVPSFLRVATGMDIHAFGPGDRVFLGGVEIPCDRGLTGHSDADVVLHAATDALLGALGLGDIGTHFPPSDPRWKGARSRVFLAFAMEKLRERGGVLDFLDIVLLCEKPRIAPFREAMRDMIAQIAGIARDEVAVKATTTEGLGFTGRGEGIFAQATATIRLPDGKIGS